MKTPQAKLAEIMRKLSHGYRITPAKPAAVRKGVFEDRFAVTQYGVQIVASMSLPELVKRFSRFVK